MWSAQESPALVFGVTAMTDPRRVPLTYISETSAHLSALDCCHDRGLVRTRSTVASIWAV